jgi:putative SOS response-associated peptidase YedK
MCGRYVTVTKIKAIEKRFNAQASQPQLYEPNTNISHGEYAPVITGDKPGELQFFQFGFTPSWAKKQFYMINARSEGDHNKTDDPAYHGEKGITNKPMFRKSIRSQRCLVIADCFIEGPKKERLSKPYVVYLKDGQHPFALAGIWDMWLDQATGEMINSFAVITTVANDLMQKIGHHRSPVVLSRDQEEAWIDPDMSLGDVTSMLNPYPANHMNAYPISDKIKNPRANGIELLEPVGERIYKEYDYEIFEEIKLFGMGESRARERKKNEEGGSQGELF